MPGYSWVMQDLDEEDLDASFEQYCQDIQETAAWGGQTELNALANVLQHHIKVYAAGLPVVDMGQQYQGESQVMLWLCTSRCAKIDNARGGKILLSVVAALPLMQQALYQRNCKLMR